MFIFISDNGQFYGEHRLAKGKVLPYQEALHLPLVIKAPRSYLRGEAPGEGGPQSRWATSTSRRRSWSFARGLRGPARTTVRAGRWTDGP